MVYDHGKLCRDTPDAPGAPAPASNVFFEELGAQTLHMPAAPQQRRLLNR
ncbi:MAG: hypothetical protein HWE35_05265 [Rhodobacteraceae bacterium]|nr:hypothetical protein [Paracoccaceae bacterium]